MRRKGVYEGTQLLAGLALRRSIIRWTRLVPDHQGAWCFSSELLILLAFP